VDVIERVAAAYWNHGNGPDAWDALDEDVREDIRAGIRAGLDAAHLRGAVEALGDAYSALTDGEGLGPDASEEAVEDARKIIADALVAFGGR